MQEEPRVEDPIDPPPFINTTQPRRVFHNTTDLKTLFSIDDVPPSKWQDQFLQMIAWIDAEMQIPEAQLRPTLVKFTSRLAGRLR